MRKLTCVAVLGVFSMAIFFGCAHKDISHGTEITEGEAAQIIDGKTTKEEVYLTFGEPGDILEDGKVFVYKWVRGSRWGIPLFIVQYSSGTAYGHSMIITFDENNVVSGHKITRGEVEATGLGIGN